MHDEAEGTEGELTNPSGFDDYKLMIYLSMDIKNLQKMTFSLIRTNLFLGEGAVAVALESSPENVESPPFSDEL